MNQEPGLEAPRVFRILEGEALEVKRSAYGSVGTLFRGEGVEAVWVSKQDEEIDPGWFSQPAVDLIMVVQGQIRVEFERQDVEPQVLEPGDFLVLPPNTRCRADPLPGRPRDRKEPAVFLAVYPLEKGSSGE